MGGKGKNDPRPPQGTTQGGARPKGRQGPLGAEGGKKDSHGAKCTSHVQPTPVLPFFEEAKFVVQLEGEEGGVPNTGKAEGNGGKGGKDAESVNLVTHRSSLLASIAPVPPLSRPPAPTLAFLKAAAKRMEFSIGTVVSSSEWYRKVGGKTVEGGG